MSTLRENRARDRRIAWNWPRQCAGSLQDGCAGSCPLRSGAKEAEAVVAEIRKGGGRADAVASDLSAPDGAHKLAKQVRAVVGDRLDILVANAGTSKSATIERPPSKISTDCSL